MNKRTVLFALLSAWLLFATLASTAQAQNDTPASDLAALFEPCAFDVGSDAGPLEDTATKQGYSYTAYSNEAATLGQFARLVKNMGLLYISTHGSARGLLVECYPGTDTGRRARDAAFADYINGTNITGNNLDNLALAAGTCIQKTKGARTGRRYWLFGPKDRTYHAIRLLDSCIRQLTTGAKNQPLIFGASCNSWGLRADFLNVREFFGYANTCTGPQNRADSRLLFQRMDGRGAPQGMARPAHGSAANMPDGSQTAFGLGGFTGSFKHRGPGNTTLAPIVNNNLDGAFAPQDSVATNTTVAGHVIFDTNMSTKVLPNFVISVRGDECTAVLQNIRWTSSTRLDFDVVVGATKGKLTFTVKGSIARSANNPINLDGNQDPSGPNGVAPNKDDFQWTVDCQNPAQAQIQPATLRAETQSNLSTHLVAPPNLLTAQQPLTSSSTPLTGSTTIVEPNLLIVTDPGRASGIFQLENLGTELEVAFFEVSSLAATNARAGTTILPMSTITTSAITIEPLVALLNPGQRAPVVMTVDVPAGQPSGLYTGTVTVMANGIDAQKLPVQFIVNQTPLLTKPITQTVRAGQTLTMTIAATDADLEPILLHAEALPDGDSEAVSAFVDNGDGTAIFTFTPEVDMVGTTVTVPLIASNIYTFDADMLDNLDYPPFIPHNVQELEIRVLSQGGIYLPLIRTEP